MIAERLRLADRSLFVKFALAPAVMLGLMVLASVLSVGALIHAQSSTTQIVNDDMHKIAALSDIAARFERADGDLYRLLVAKAAGNGMIDVPARAKAIKLELTQVQGDLSGMRAQMKDKAALDHAVRQIKAYGETVDVVTAMLDVDFASSATMLAPFRENARHVVRDVKAIADAGIADSDAHAAAIAWQIRIMAGVVMLAMVGVACFGLILTRIIGRVTVESITRIASATAELAEAHYDIDLAALDRGDELGTVVTALKTFRDQALEGKRLQVEKDKLERQAREQEEQSRLAIEMAREEADHARRDQLQRLAGEFDSKFAGMIRSAQDAMARLDAGLSRLDASAADNRGLAAELEKVADSLSGEMGRVQAATDTLTTSIRRIDHEVDETNEVAKAISLCAETSRRAVMESVGKAQSVAQVVSIIDDIARQTQSLALNATIEASRAGEVGEGFAVVAKEIKQLSSRTGGSTKDVRDKVNDIQHGIGELVDVTAQLGDLIHSMNQVASHVAGASAAQVRSTDEIVARVDAVQARAHYLVEASSAIREQSMANQKLVGEVRVASQSMLRGLADLERDAQEFTAHLR
ncbi:MAG: methyl-accepting chemotaxis protein [Sphingobium sp.]